MLGLLFGKRKRRRRKAGAARGIYRLFMETPRRSQNPKAVAKRNKAKSRKW